MRLALVIMQNASLLLLPCRCLSSTRASVDKYCFNGDDFYLNPVRQNYPHAIIFVQIRRRGLGTCRQVVSLISSNHTNI